MLAYLFILLAIAVHIRWVALPFSFTPVVAALLYFGARMPRKQMWIPLAMLVATGVYLSRETYGYPFTADLLFVWGWYAAMILFGGKVIKGWSPLRIGAATLAGSASFFLVSNFGTWLVWHMYPKSFSGLMTCYVAGLPFFRNAIASDLFFSAAFFGIGYLLSHRAEEGEKLVVSRQ